MHKHFFRWWKLLILKYCMSLCVGISIGISCVTGTPAQKGIHIMLALYQILSSRNDQWHIPRMQMDCLRPQILLLQGSWLPWSPCDVATALSYTQGVWAFRKFKSHYTEQVFSWLWWKCMLFVAGAKEKALSCHYQSALVMSTPLVQSILTGI